MRPWASSFIGTSTAARLSFCLHNITAIARIDAPPVLILHHTANNTHRQAWRRSYTSDKITHFPCENPLTSAHTSGLILTQAINPMTRVLASFHWETQLLYTTS
jgi:hypothetical protein